MITNQLQFTLNKFSDVLGSLKTFNLLPIKNLLNHVKLCNILGFINISVLILFLVILVLTHHIISGKKNSRFILFYF